MKLPPMPWGVWHDLEYLLAFSNRLRAEVALRERNPEKARQEEAVFKVIRLQDQLRLDLRVDIDRIREHPKDAREGVRFMRRPNLMHTQDYLDLQWHVSRERTDVRVQIAADWAIALAAREGVPLWPSKWSASSVELDHMHNRQLPWACWHVIDGYVAEASKACGFGLRRVVLNPGQFELDEDAPALDPADVPKRYRRRYGTGSAAERQALWEYYQGGPWAPPEPVSTKEQPAYSYRKDPETGAFRVVAIEHDGKERWADE